MKLNLEELAWSVAEGKTEAYTFRNRFRHFLSSLETKNFPIRLNIFWNLENKDIDGNSIKDDLEKVHTFEDRIVEAVEGDEFSILSMVLTGNGQREFVFHTSAPNEFLQRLTNMPQEE